MSRHRCNSHLGLHSLQLLSDQIALLLCALGTPDLKSNRALAHEHGILIHDLFPGLIDVTLRQQLVTS